MAAARYVTLTRCARDWLRAPRTGRGRARVPISPDAKVLTLIVTPAALMAIGNLREQRLRWLGATAEGGRGA